MALMIQQLAHNFAKNGYYLTDPELIETILDRLVSSCVEIEASWFNNNGEEWEFITTIEIDNCTVNQYRGSLIDGTDIYNCLALNGIDGLSYQEISFFSKTISSFILETAKKTVPTVSAHDYYYGY